MAEGWVKDCGWGGDGWERGSPRGEEAPGSRKLMSLKFLKKSKELSLKEFNSGKLTWDSNFNTTD